MRGNIKVIFDFRYFGCFGVLGKFVIRCWKVICWLIILLWYNDIGNSVLWCGGIWLVLKIVVGLVVVVEFWMKFFNVLELIILLILIFLVLERKRRWLGLRFFRFCKIRFIGFEVFVWWLWVGLVILSRMVVVSLVMYFLVGKLLF